MPNSGPLEGLAEPAGRGELADALDIPRYKWIFCASVSVFLVAFLLAFQPFGVNNFDPQFRLSAPLVLSVAAIGLVVFLTLVFNEFVLRRILVRNNDLVRLVGWLAWTYLLVSTVVFLFYNFIGNWHDFRWGSYLGFVRDVGMVITLPVAGFLFFIRHESLKSEFTQLKSFQAVAPTTRLVHFLSDNLKENFSVALDDVLFLESQDNYLEVTWEEGQLRSTLIRSSLKKQETTLGEPTLMRCHRSFMVNLSRVRRCQGNRHGLKLGLSGTDRVIPVSRAFTSDILEKLENLQLNH